MKYLMALLVSFFFLVQTPISVNAAVGTDCTKPNPASQYAEWCGVWEGVWDKSKNPAGLYVTEIDGSGKIRGWYLWGGKVSLIRGRKGIIVGDTLTVNLYINIYAKYRLKGSTLLAVYCRSSSCSATATLKRRRAVTNATDRDLRPRPLIGPPPKEAIRCEKMDSSNPYIEWCGNWSGKWSSWAGKYLMPGSSSGLIVSRIGKSGEVYGRYRWRNQTTKIDNVVNVGTITDDILKLRFGSGSSVQYTLNGDHLSAIWCESGSVGSCSGIPIKGSLNRVPLKQKPVTDITK